MKRSKNIFSIGNYKLFFAAVTSTLSLSSCLFIFALLTDRGKPVHRNSYRHDAEQWHKDDRLITTSLFDDKEAFFNLVDDTEWRLANGRDMRRARRSSGDTGQLSSNSYYSTSRTFDDGHTDFDCETVAKMVPSMSFLAAGWTKAVYKAKLNDVDLAVKTVDVTGQDVDQCLEKQRNSGVSVNIEQCHQKAAKKIVKEIALLKHLQHPNVIKVLGYCIPKIPDAKDSRRRVAIVTEIGEPVNLIRLLQLSWEDRLKIVFSLAKLLSYLADHQLGSLVMNDMRRQQFVLVNGELKLVDVDDIGLEEPKCRSDDDCSTFVTNLKPNINTSNFEPSVPCKNGYCQGFNEIRNIYNAARHFTTFLLPYGAPPGLQSMVQFIVDSFQNQTSNAQELLRLMTSLVRNYSSGSYLPPNKSKTNTTNFVELPQSDLTGVHDYSCQGSKTQISCTLSMVNVQEARSLCFEQPICKAFVWTNEKTWTGRNIVHFKNNYSSPVYNVNTQLYLKV